MLEGERALSEGERALSPDAERLEALLLGEALASDMSLRSDRDELVAALRPLAARCRTAGVISQVLLVRAYGQVECAFAVHWIDRQVPSAARRSAFYGYWDTVGFAVGAARERERFGAELARLRAHAYVDRLTGLPNGLALERELERQAEALPFSALALDFDGMREANAKFSSYELGGDVLIKAVGRAIGELAGGVEFAARMHTAGDEFVILLPGAGATAAHARAGEIEGSLDALEVPEAHRDVYHGASVGAATRTAGETPGQVLGRAIDAMRRRKQERTESRHRRPPPG